MKLFLFDFHGTVKVARAMQGEQALDEIQKTYNYDRTMLRKAMIELTVEPQTLFVGDGFREAEAGIIYDQGAFLDAEAKKSRLVVEIEQVQKELNRKIAELTSFN